MIEMRINGCLTMRGDRLCDFLNMVPGLVGQMLIPVRLTKSVAVTLGQLEADLPPVLFEQDDFASPNDDALIARAPVFLALEQEPEQSAIRAVRARVERLYNGSIAMRHGAAG